MTGTLSKETKVSIGFASGLVVLLLRLTFLVLEAKTAIEAKITLLETTQTAKNVATEVVLASQHVRLLALEQRSLPVPPGNRWTCGDQERFLFDLGKVNADSKFRIPMMRKACGE